MAGGNVAPVAVVIDRASIDRVNREKSAVNADFAYADYIALSDFFSEMSDIQEKMINGENLRIGEFGLEVDPHTLEGAVVLQVHLQNLQAKRDVLQAMAKLGLKIEREAWKQS